MWGFRVWEFRALGIEPGRSRPADHETAAALASAAGTCDAVPVNALASEAVPAAGAAETPPETLEEIDL